MNSINFALAATIEAFRELRQLYDEETKGIFSPFIEAVGVMFEAINDGLPKTTTDKYVADLFNTVTKANRVLADEPFCGPCDINALATKGFEFLLWKEEGQKTAQLEAEIAPPKAKLEQREATAKPAENKDAEVLLKLAEMQGTLASVLARLSVKEPVQSTPVSSCQETLQRLETADKRWAEWLLEINNRADDLQAQLEENEDKASALQQQARFGSVTPNGQLRKLQMTMETIRDRQTSLNGLIRHGTEQIRVLHQLAESLKLLQNGIDNKLLTPPEVPEEIEIAKPAENTPTPVTPEPVPVPTVEVSERDKKASVAYCKMMAEKNSLSTDVVLYVTLYDLLSKKDSGGSDKRNNRKVVAIAIKLGMLTRFGIGTARDFLTNWTREKKADSERWIKFAGEMRKGDIKYPMYRRSDEKLPWDPRCLFSDVEISAFKKMINEKKAPATAR